MLHVRDVNASIAFYEACGMRALSFAERPSGAAGSFVGYGEYRDAEHFALELSAPSPKSKQASSPVELGSGFQGMAFGDLNLSAALNGGGRRSSRSTAACPCVEDPDGYPVSSQPMADAGDRFCSLTLRVSDLEASRSFYCNALGMLEQSGEASESDRTCCLLRCGAGGAGGAPVALALVEREGEGPVEHGSGFDHLAVSTPDVHAAAAELQSAGVDVFLPPTVMFGINITGLRDPDGYSIYLTEEEGFRRR